MLIVYSKDAYHLLKRCLSFAKVMLIVSIKHLSDIQMLILQNKNPLKLNENILQF